VPNGVFDLTNFLYSTNRPHLLQIPAFDGKSFPLKQPIRHSSTEMQASSAVQVKRNRSHLLQYGRNSAQNHQNPVDLPELVPAGLKRGPFPKDSVWS